MSDCRLDEAMGHHRGGRCAEAAALYRAILCADPDNADGLHLLGLLHVEQGDPARGIVLIRMAMRRDPGQAAHYNSLGQAYHRLGRRNDAMEAFLTASRLQPGRAEIHNNLATVLLDLGRRTEAIAHYWQATAAAPGIADIWFNLANALAEDGADAEAERCYRQTVALRPGHAAALANYGRFLMQHRRRAEAEAALAEAVRLDPTQAGAWNNLGVLRQDRAPAIAATCFRAALAADPALALARTNLGCLLSADGRTDDALASHRAALAADPASAAARLAACMAHLPVLYRTEKELTRRRADYAAALRDLARTADAAAFAEIIGRSQPFFLPYQAEDDHALQSLYGRFASAALAAAPPPRPPAIWRGGRLRLGIVSGFFCDHTLFKLFLEGWLTHLDRRRFEITGFHTGAVADARTDWSAAQCDRFVQDLSSPAAWRQAVAAEDPHVLLYPEVGIDPVAGNLAAARLAAVQCAAWGQPVTTGLPTIDWFLSSDLMEPDGADDLYSERLIRLPGLGTCYRPGAPPPRRLDRAALGLDPEAVVFWSGQALYKYLPRHDALFPRIAAGVGHCQFVFIAFARSAAVTGLFRKRLHAAFAAAGLDPARHVVILPPLSQADYLDAVTLADVVLDTPDWSGGKSTLDCLAADPAIVTWPGRFMRGRHTAAILARIGCTETIARSADEYVALAVRLARDAGWRTAVRQAVRMGKDAAYNDTAPVRALEDFLSAAVAGAAADISLSSLSAGADPSGP